MQMRSRYIEEIVEEDMPSTTHSRPVVPAQTDREGRDREPIAMYAPRSRSARRGVQGEGA
jgi:hypothetical protein